MSQIFCYFRRSSVFVAAALLVSPTLAKTPETAYDGEWVSISGTVESVAEGTFMLDYGKKSIPVEMDGYDWYDSKKLMVGDKVSVTGRMDDDFFQKRSIEANSLFVNSRRTIYFANPADEEATLVPMVDHDLLRNGRITLTGNVQSIDGEVFVLDTGTYEYRVDTGSLFYDPFDRAGIQHIAVGDRVSVTGSSDDADLFDKREIDATSLTELSTS